MSDGMWNPEWIFAGEDNFDEIMKSKVDPLFETLRSAGSFESFDGTMIHYEYYIHPEAVGTVVICHGFCEFTRKFDEVAFYFYQAGYSVFLYDNRGHGYSDRKVDNMSKVHIHSFHEYVEDLHEYMEQIVMRESGEGPFILYAHSMGGAIGALYLEEHPEIFEKAVLSSPMMEVEVGKYPVPVTWTVMYAGVLTGHGDAYVPAHGDFDGVPVFAESSCLSEARYNRIFKYRLDNPHYQTYGGSFAWTLASLKAVKKLQKHAGSIRIPVLVYQAGLDTVVRNPGQNLFCSKVASATLKVAADSKHEIYNSKTECRQKYYEDIFSFLA